MSILHYMLSNLIWVWGGRDYLVSISGSGSMRPCLPSSLAVGVGKLGEGGGRGGRRLSLLPPCWGQVVGNTPTTSSAAPKLFYMLRIWSMPRSSSS